MKSSPFLNLINKDNPVKHQKEFLDTNTSEKKIIFSKQLLNKDLLLTPHLKKNFGDVYVSETGLKHIESEEIYIRESVIKQKNTDYKILDANLRIEKKNVPIQLINDLRSTSILFGSLLKKYNIDVTIVDQRIIVMQDVDDNETMRMGRSRTMLKKGTDDVICHVHELLNSEQSLLTAKEHIEKA